jgi:hypothetical protein
LQDTRIKTMGRGKTPNVGESGMVEILVYSVGTKTEARSPS